MQHTSSGQKKKACTNTCEEMQKRLLILLNLVCQMAIQAALNPQFRFFSKPLLHCRRGGIVAQKKKNFI